MFLIACVAIARAASADPAFAPATAGFNLHYRDEVSSYSINPLFVVPHEAISLHVSGIRLDERIDVSVSGGRLRETGARSWTWFAPASPGLYPIRLQRRSAGSEMTVNAFVLVPMSAIRDGKLNDYQIGKYPSTPLKKLPAYRTPSGFIEVTPENRDVPLTPHFRLGQFLCKQASGYPKYVVLRERLLFKLELLLETVNARGFQTSTLEVMSGYRTPFYNKAIGNDTSYSRHVFGDAADIFIDVSPRDGVMDDLNRDGKIDQHDAQVLFEIIDELAGKSHYLPFLGGLARYRATVQHGPFVHVDTRGFRARW